MSTSSTCPLSSEQSRLYGGQSSEGVLDKQKEREDGGGGGRQIR